jgi:putative oxidoreductase
MESHSTSSTVSRAANGRGLRIALWSAQIALAIVFALAGGMKVSTAAADLAKMAPGFPLALLRLIGIAELAGAIGIILPALTRIAPVLTPLASSGFVIVMASAAVLHLVRGELGELAVVIVLGALATFVAWGRFKRAPIARRERAGMTRLHLDEGRQS